MSEINDRLQQLADRESHLRGERKIWASKRAEAETTFNEARKVYDHDSTLCDRQVLELDGQLATLKMDKQALRGLAASA